MEEMANLKELRERARFMTFLKQISQEISYICYLARNRILMPFRIPTDLLVE